MISMIQTMALTRIAAGISEDQRRETKKLNIVFLHPSVMCEYSAHEMRHDIEFMRMRQDKCLTLFLTWTEKIVLHLTGSHKMQK